MFKNETWVGCHECDITFPCNNGETRCIRLQPKKSLTSEQIVAAAERSGAIVLEGYEIDMLKIFAKEIERMHGIIK